MEVVGMHTVGGRASGCSRRWARPRSLASLAIISTPFLIAMVLVGVPPSAEAATRVPPLVIVAPTDPTPAGGTFTARLLFTSPFSGSLKYSMVGLPFRATWNLTTLNSRERRLQVQIPLDTPVGIFAVRFRTLNAGTKRTYNFLLSISAPATPPPTAPPPPPPTVAPSRPDFQLQLPDSRRLVRLGGSTSIAVRIIRNNWSGPVRLTLDGVPAGASAGFLPVNPTSDQLSDLRIVIPTSVTAGDYVMRVTGSAADPRGDVVREALFLLRVRGPESIALAVASGGSVEAGRSAVIGELDVTVVNGDGPVAIGFEGVPTGINLSVSPNPLIGRSSLTATVAPGATIGVVSFTIVASSSEATIRVVGSLRVLPPASPTLRFFVTPVTPLPGESFGYVIASSVSALTLPRGSSTQILISVAPKGGFNQAIDLTATGIPFGVVAVFEATGTPNLVRMILTVPSNQPTSTSTVQVRATSGSLTAAIPIGFTVG